MTMHSPAPDDAQTVHLKDYQPFSHLLPEVTLAFDLDPKATRVRAALSLAPNPAAAKGADLFLHGKDLHLISARIDGQEVQAQLDARGLTIAARFLPDRPFLLETEVQIDPASNTALDGLYLSNGMFCTQCEAEGFRKITFYPDRPDVMSRFKVRIKSDLPVLLSNGNLVGEGKGWAEWHDPWPKPAYLFALVAGDLRAHRGGFRTRSGRDVALNIWVRPGDEGRCAFAMEALIASMAWDERVYGREYDLDIFNIVAVDDFNMGAMENKGLNIFNSKVVLASPDIATDEDYARIEAIIAHEYFHNWTGNRITCRDWFQLCLKEGLTVFRDQQFSGDMRGHAVKRIESVLALRARQFREDQGPLAHPVRPESFVEINNFYTATVYEKGAEVIGMLRALVGPADYDRALALYFDRHDGQAATIEDWLRVFEDVTGRDLTQFSRWYSQAGTPRLAVSEAWDPAPDGGTFTLTFVQKTPPTPGQDHKGPKAIPIAVGLLNPNGDEIRPTQVLEMDKTVQSFAFGGLAARPVASILRGFSAPVMLERDLSPQTAAFLLAHDTDPFNRWEAGRDLMRTVLTQMITKGDAPQPGLLQGLGRVALDAGLDPAYRALCLRLPAEDDLAGALARVGHVPDPDLIRKARQELHQALAQSLARDLPDLAKACQAPLPYRPDAASAGLRALRLVVLGLMARLAGGLEQVRAAFAEAGNMTESIGTLAILLEAGAGQDELAAFEARWRQDRLVMDKWFMIQAQLAPADRLGQIVAELTERPDFDLRNPNRFRAVLGGLAANHAGFHHGSGAGYRILADWLIRLDPLNPQTAARVSGAFETWARYDARRQALARAEMGRILATPGLSPNLAEMVSRMLAG